MLTKDTVSVSKMSLWKKNSKYFGKLLKSLILSIRKSAAA